MSIKAKLIANVLLTAIMIIAISVASFFLMRFLQGKLSYLTEKSTPYQVKSIELQRELHGAVTSLVKVTTARTLPEFTSMVAEAESSLVSVENAQNAVEKMNAGMSDVSHDLDSIALELFSAVKSRIQSNDAASKANASVLQSMKESSARLNDLDSSIRGLQVNYTRAFAGALEKTAAATGKLRSIEELRNLIRELQLIAMNVQNIQSGTSVLIAKGKQKAMAVRIAKNEYYKTNRSIAVIVNGFMDVLSEYVRLKSVTLAQNDDDSKSRTAAVGKDIPDKLGSLFQTLDQEAMLARDELSFANSRQALLFNQSSTVNSILVANSELMALGLRVTGLTNQMFTLDSRPELDRLGSELIELFSKIHERVQIIENALISFNDRKELDVLRATVTSLTTIRSEIYSANGILTTLRSKLKAIEQSQAAADKLHEIVRQQIAKGRISIVAAQAEQETSIAEVNSTIKLSLFSVVAVGAVAIVIGMFFGLWIYRSVLLPLHVVLDAVRRQQTQVREKADLAEAVAGGDLNREVVVNEAMPFDSSLIKDDEMGLVLDAVVSMSKAQVTLDSAFSDMTASLRSSRDDAMRRDRLKSGLYELNRILRGEQKTVEMADRSLAYIADYLGAGVGIMYLYDENSRMLQPLSTYAVSESKRLTHGFALGEGLPGQVALERKIITLEDIPANYLPIVSSLGGADPRAVTLLPIMHNDDLLGVLELGSFKPFSDDDFSFLEQTLENIAIAFKANRSRQLVSELLEKTQQQTEELRLRQEELEQTNEELVERAHVQMELLKSTGN